MIGITSLAISAGSQNDASAEGSTRSGKLGHPRPASRRGPGQGTRLRADPKARGLNSSPYCSWRSLFTVQLLCALDAMFALSCIARDLNNAVTGETYRVVHEN